MTRKDYKLIAEAICRAGRSHEDIPQEICEALAQDNPKFNPVLFLATCYGTGIKQERWVESKDITPENFEI